MKPGTKVVLEVERHPIYAHTGYVPRYKVTKKTLCVYKVLDDGRVTFRAMRRDRFGRWPMFTLSRKQEWLIGHKSKYAVIRVVSKKPGGCKP